MLIRHVDARRPGASPRPQDDGRTGGRSFVWYYENIEGGHAGAADNAQTGRVKSALSYSFPAACWIETDPRVNSSAGPHVHVSEPWPCGDFARPGQQHDHLMRDRVTAADDQGDVELLMHAGLAVPTIAPAIRRTSPAGVDQGVVDVAPGELDAGPAGRTTSSPKPPGAAMALPRLRATNSVSTANTPGQHGQADD